MRSGIPAFRVASTQTIATLAIGLSLVVAILAEPRYNEALGAITAVRSEYTLTEQVTKLYYLFITFLGICFYNRETDWNRVIVSITFILTGLLLYFAESNFFTQWVQPLFGVCVLSATLWALIRVGHVPAAAASACGIGVIAFAFFVDHLSENLSLLAMVPLLNEELILRLAVAEETYDVVAAALFCLSALLFYSSEVAGIWARCRAACILFFISLTLIAFSNGFLHWQYEPWWRMEVVSLTMVFVAIAGIALGNSLIETPEEKVRLISEPFFYFVMYCAYAILPTVFDDSHAMTDFVLWAPGIIGTAFYLYYRHPARSVETAHSGLAGAQTSR